MPSDDDSDCAMASATTFFGGLDYANKKTLFDVTIYDSHHKYEHYSDLFTACAAVFKRFAFQQEKCPTSGTLHWQVRGALYHQEWANVLKRDLIPKFPGNWSLTSTNVHKSARQFNYVMKEQSRVQGPWTEKDAPKDPPKMTKQLELFINGGLYQGQFLTPGYMPWMKTIEDFISHFDMRHIFLVQDTWGNSRKSMFAEYLEFMGKAFELPPMRMMEDIMQFAYSFDDQTCYLVDMPRGMKKDKLADFYAGLEALKDGKVYDKRYGGKKRRMNRPHIVVFTNTLPCFSLMSMDRWRVFEMQEDKTLKERKELTTG